MIQDEKNPKHYIADKGKVFVRSEKNKRPHHYPFRCPYVYLKPGETIEDYKEVDINPSYEKE